MGDIGFFYIFLAIFLLVSCSAALCSWKNYDAFVPSNMISAKKKKKESYSVALISCITLACLDVTFMRL